MQGDDRVIELLNEVLTAELTAVDQYLLDRKLFGNWGYERLAIEREAIERLTRGMALCVEISDGGSRELLEGTLEGENRAYRLESQLEMVSQLDDAHCLAQQNRD